MLQPFRAVRLLALVLVGAAAAADVSAQWQTVVPGGDTVCSDGTPYRFFVHPGDPAKLLVEFEGGGACWNAETCEAPIYTRRIVLDPAEVIRLGLLQGVYERTRADNPLRDFTHVYIPYCTGDLHWGNATQTYAGSKGPYTVHHRGALNAKAALQWTYENVLAPSQLLVAGCSAGGYGATAWSADVMMHYPGASAAHLSDSAAGIVPQDFFASVLGTWGVRGSPAWPPIASLDIDRLDLERTTLADMYDGVAGHLPLATFAQFNTLLDSTQVFYYQRSGGTPQDWSARMLASVARIQANNPNFTAYTAPGSQHCVINRSELYTTAVAGVRLVDWLRALVAGPRPASVP